MAVVLVCVLNSGKDADKRRALKLLRLRAQSWLAPNFYVGR
jgi:hypothetical protein